MHALNIFWNPSKGIDLGVFTLHYYSLMWIVAFLLGFYIVKRIFKNENQFLFGTESKGLFCRMKFCIADKAL